MTRFMITTLGLAYAFGAIVTFGCVYNRTECLSGDANCADYKAAAGLISGMVWPLTVSAILQEGAGK